MLIGLLLPDPCEADCPQEFKEKARAILLEMDGRRQGWTALAATDRGLRQILMEFIADFADWDNSTSDTYIKAGRALVKAAYDDDSPLVVDPFAGGGSIPLEALRLGCETFASDLNPVACLILKVMLDEIPRHGPDLVKELRKARGEIHQKAKEELSDIYPIDPDGSIPVAYLWARTVRCEAPECGAEIPLMRSMWLCNKPNRKWALQLNATKPDTTPPSIEFEIFQPVSEKDVSNGTIARANATCQCCGIVLSPERVRTQLFEQRGGADVIYDDEGRRIGGARLTAVVTISPDIRGRRYRLATEEDYIAIKRSQVLLQEILDQWKDEGSNKLCPVPDEPLPPVGTLGFRVQRYGMLQWGDLFTARQKVSLVVLCRLMQISNESVKKLLSIAIDRTADGGASISRWVPSGEMIVNVFARQALPVVWDFGEANNISDVSKSWFSAIDTLSKVIELASWLKNSAQTQQADATDSPLPDGCADIWFTDPPYYDAIPYSDLSDFFLVWLKRTMPDHPMLLDPFDSKNPLSPKEREIVQDETKECNGRVKDRNFFEGAMGEALAEGRRVLRDDGIGSVVFAHKTTEGWEALLLGMINGGWKITASWPIATEMASRLRARDSAALATSVHLVCRPRPEDASVGDWADVLRKLPKRVSDWMERLQGEGIRGADLVFACVGPALEIFSRYSRVETAEGREVKLPEYLEKVWEVVGRTALEQVLGTAEARASNDGGGGPRRRFSAYCAFSLDFAKYRQRRRRERGGSCQGNRWRIQPSLRCSAPFRPADGHRPRRLDRSHHRTEERLGATATR